VFIAAHAASTGLTIGLVDNLSVPSARMRGLIEAHGGQTRWTMFEPVSRAIASKRGASEPQEEEAARNGTVLCPRCERARLPC
jgi:hypothetical protein